MLESSGTWTYISASAVNFPDQNTTGTQIIIPGSRWVDKSGKHIFQPLELRYAWEDFPECAIYNSDGLPMPPFNITIPRALGEAEQPLSEVERLRAELAEAKQQLALMRAA